MSARISNSQVAGSQAGARAVAGAEVTGRRRRGGRVIAGIAVLAGAGAMSAWAAGAFSAVSPPGTGGSGLLAPATAAVVREDIAAVTPVAATLGYAGSWTVTGQGSGTLTLLPQPGQVIRQGQLLYRIGNGCPVVLLYGSKTVIEDLNSTNGTYVNAERVSRRTLKEGDIVTLGKSEFRFVLRPAPERAP